MKSEIDTLRDVLRVTRLELESLRAKAEVVRVREEQLDALLRRVAGSFTRPCSVGGLNNTYQGMIDAELLRECWRVLG